MIHAEMVPVTNEIREIFDYFDRDKSGAIDSDEFRSLLQAMDAYESDDELQIGLSIIDTNGNGQIEYDEFARYWKRR